MSYNPSAFSPQFQSIIDALFAVQPSYKPVFALVGRPTQYSLLFMRAMPIQPAPGAVDTLNRTVRECVPHLPRKEQILLKIVAEQRGWHLRNSELKISDSTATVVLSEIQAYASVEAKGADPSGLEKPVSVERWVPPHVPLLLKDGLVEVPVMVPATPVQSPVPAHEAMAGQLGQGLSPIDECSEGSDDEDAAVHRSLIGTPVEKFAAAVDIAPLSGDQADLVSEMVKGGMSQQEAKDMLTSFADYVVCSGSVDGPDVAGFEMVEPAARSGQFSVQGAADVDEDADFERVEAPEAGLYSSRNPFQAAEENFEDLGEGWETVKKP